MAAGLRIRSRKDPEPKEVLAKNTMTESRCAEILSKMRSRRIAVIGDVILDYFVWGTVRRISPEAPVPVVDFVRETYMPGGAANVARNVTALGGRAELFGVVGKDTEALRLVKLLADDEVRVGGLVATKDRHTTVKMRIVSGQQQITRLDRETKGELDERSAIALDARVAAALGRVDGVVVGDYDKGVLSPQLLQILRQRCRQRKIWLSLDPKPSRKLDLRGLSLITPNRREAFQLAEIADTTRHPNPCRDPQLMRVAARLLERYVPKVLLITLGELGMLVCQKGRRPIHIPTVAREVFDVSGAGDTVIASFTLAIVAGATSEEAAEISNHAAGIVVGKLGTATVSSRELSHSFRCDNRH